MKTLVVMRHAEAGQASRDFDRPLTDYGRAQAVSTASQLSEALKVDYMIVSAACRTRETAKYLVDSLSLAEDQFRFEERVYEASTGDLAEVIGTFPEESNVAVLVGHNPSVSSFVSSITDSYEGFSTGCAIVLQLETEDWHTVLSSKASRLHKFLPQI